ncbi:MAG: hypothetical protein V1717_03725 [Candidatus Micrarchaeota archaeon]
MARYMKTVAPLELPVPRLLQYKHLKRMLQRSDETRRAVVDISKALGLRRTTLAEANEYAGHLASLVEHSGALHAKASEYVKWLEENEDALNRLNKTRGGNKRTVHNILESISGNHEKIVALLKVKVVGRKPLLENPHFRKVEWATKFAFA